jgi:Holliday junction resolvase RusA-like endonuclease
VSPRKPSTARSSVRDHRHPPSAQDGQPGPSESIPVTLTIPGKPISTNQTYRTGRGGRWFKDPVAAAWQASVSLAARRAMRGRDPFTGEVEVTVVFWFDSRRPDADGPVKGLLDRLVPAVLLNDRQVTSYSVTKRLDPEAPRTEVTVRPWPAVVEPTPEFVNAWEAIHEHGQGEARHTAEQTVAGRAYHEGKP